MNSSVSPDIAAKAREIVSWHHDSAPLLEKDIAFALQAEREVRQREIDTLRTIVSHCARSIGNGAFISPEASLEFMAKLPREIQMAMNSIVGDRDHHKKHAVQLVDGIRTLRGMVREAIEDLFGPVANLESEEATLLRGPEPKHDAEAINAALVRVHHALVKANKAAEGDA